MSDLRRPLLHALHGPIAVSLVALTAGCESETHTVGSPKPQPAVNAPAPADNFIVSKTTTDIKATTDTMPTNAQQASPKMVARDPISLPGNAYVTIIGRTTKDKMKHDMDLFYATNERYPKDLNEFMEQIIRPNGTKLPQLPFYQEYRYNEMTHELEIWEYPDKKAGPAPQ